MQTEFKQAEVVEVLVALGVDTAPDWDLPTLQAKVNAAGGLARFFDGTTALPAHLGTIYDDIAKAQAAGHDVSVAPAPVAPVEPKGKKGAAKKKKAVGKTAAIAAPKAKTKSKSKPRSKAKPDGTVTAHEKGRHKTYAERQIEWKKRWGKIGQPISEKAVVAKALFDILCQAGRGRKPEPLTKDEILKIMVQRFPDRDPNKMSTTINNFIPTRFCRKHHVYVWSVRDKGFNRYWIKGDGKTPQPVEAQA